MNSKTNQRKPSAKFLSLICAAALLFALAGCGKSSQQKIVGKWSLGNSKEFIFDFTESGEIIMFINGKQEKKEKYRFIDDGKLEMEPAQGEKVIVDVSFTDDDKTMTTKSSKGVTTTFKRQ